MARTINTSRISTSHAAQMMRVEFIRAMARRDTMVSEADETVPSRVARPAKNDARRPRESRRMKKNKKKVVSARSEGGSSGVLQGIEASSTNKLDDKREGKVTKLEVRLDQEATSSSTQPSSSTWGRKQRRTGRYTELECMEMKLDSKKRKSTDAKMALDFIREDSAKNKDGDLLVIGGKRPLRNNPQRSTVEKPTNPKV